MEGTVWLFTAPGGGGSRGSGIRALLRIELNPPPPVLGGPVVGGGGPVPEAGGSVPVAGISVRCLLGAGSSFCSSFCSSCDPFDRFGGMMKRKSKENPSRLNK